MACNSVAVSSAIVSQVNLDLTEMKNLLSSITGIKAESIYAYAYDATESYAQVTLNGNVEVYIEQIDGKITLKVYTSNQATADATKAKLEPLLQSGMVIAQQRTVLRRLAELGKLSNVKQTNGGVVAKLQITI
jgi:hypothetical protein